MRLLHKTAEEQRGATKRHDKAKPRDAGQHQAEPRGVFDGKAARQPVGPRVVIVEHALQAGDLRAGALEPPQAEREAIEDAIAKGLTALDLLLAGEMDKALLKVHARPPRPKPAPTPGKANPAPAVMPVVSATAKPLVAAPAEPAPTPDKPTGA